MSARGEGVIPIEDREVRILFTNRAIADAEQELGRGIIGVAQSFLNGGGIGDVATLLRAGMEAARRDSKAGGRPITMLDAYEVLDTAGFATVAAVVMEAVGNVLGYNGSNTANNGSDPNG